MFHLFPSDHIESVAATQRRNGGAGGPEARGKLGHLGVVGEAEPRQRKSRHRGAELALVLGFNRFFHIQT